jgi:hypothetical protein
MKTLLQAIVFMLLIIAAILAAPSECHATGVDEHLEVLRVTVKSANDACLKGNRQGCVLFYSTVNDLFEADDLKARTYVLKLAATKTPLQLDKLCTLGLTAVCSE